MSSLFTGEVMYGVEEMGLVPGTNSMCTFAGCLPKHPSNRKPVHASSRPHRPLHTLVDGQGGIYIDQLLQILGFHFVHIAWLSSLQTIYGRGVDLFPS
jgi:hypothetical protein